MPLIRQPIPAMYGGVSQQSATIRSPIQCEDAENCLLSVATGCSKRPPMEFRRRISSTINFDDAAYAWIAAEDRTNFLLIIPKAGASTDLLTLNIDEDA